MSFFNIKNFFKFSLLLIIFLGLILGVTCVENPVGHPIDQGLSGSVPTIIKTSQPCCEISISQRLDSLKNILLAGPQAIGGDLTLLVFSSTLALFGYRRRFSQNLFDRNDFACYKLYLKNNPQLSLFNHWEFYFALGTPNPKIY